MRRASQIDETIVSSIWQQMREYSRKHPVARAGREKRRQSRPSRDEPGLQAQDHTLIHNAEPLRPVGRALVAGPLRP
jgi:hypothetical protein